MEISIKRSEKMLSDGGIVHVIVSVELPEIVADGGLASRLSSYYGALRRLYHSVAEEYLARERLAYEADPDPKKRFTHRPLCLCCRTEISGEGPYWILRRVSLSRKGALLFERETVEGIDARRGLIPPPKQKRPVARGKRKKRGKM